MSSKSKRYAELETGVLDPLLGYQLRRAQQTVFTHFAQLFGERKITPGRLGLLLKIQHNPGVSQVALARSAGIERSTLGEVIDSFEDEGWVERRRSPTDRRSYALHLTPAGERFLATIMPEVEAHEREVTGHFTDAERATLVELLRRVTERR